MCGITGFNWNNKKLISKLTNSISHRGPDSQGIYTNPDISLGHRRLSILDLSKLGNQPMFSKNKKHSIIFNGEIFNYVNLRNDLINKGYIFKSKTDTEVLLNLYIEYGKKCLKKLNGQFSFCIYDSKRNELFLARDRLGINPLYYFNDGSKFVFGSELKTIMKSNKKLTINEDALNYYLLFGNTPTKQSIFNKVYKLRPAEYAVYNLKSKKLTTKKYWISKFKNEIKNESKAKKLLLEKLDKSVKDRLMSDVPVGAFLSGGLDSSAVVALMSKYTSNLNTFSVKFDHTEFDESEYAKLVSKQFKTKHHSVKFKGSDVSKLIPRLINHYDEPFGDPSMIPTFLLSKIASQKVKVVLSGDGSDELLGGYKSYKHRRILNIQNFYPKSLNKVAYLLFKKLNLNRNLTTFFEIGQLPNKQKFPRLMSGINAKEFKNLTGKNISKYYSKYYSKTRFSNFLDQSQNTDLNRYLPDNCLTKVDRSALAHGLEARPPFLDHEFVEFANKLSPKLRLNGNISKYILKKSFEGILPNKIIYRKKQGFGVPLKYYFKKELKPYVKKYLINYDKHNLFNTEYIKNNLDYYIKNNPRLIWRIIIFNLWWEKWQ